MVLMRRAPMKALGRLDWARVGRWSLAGLVAFIVAKGSIQYLQYRSAKLHAAGAMPAASQLNRCEEPPAGSSAAERTMVRRVNINRATRQELMTLPGVGPVLADEIVRYREIHGPFRKVEDLLIIPNIGTSRFARLAPLICAE